MPLVIVGLGNFGEKYKNNRHNAGFMFIDYLTPLLHCYPVKKKNNLIIQQCNNEFFLSKPQAFMNQSGQIVKKIIGNLKLEVKNLSIAHDDLDIPLGKFKIQKRAGPKLHNGILSIEKSLKRKDFWRIRIGVDNRQSENRVDGETYVLQDFTSDEKKVILQTFQKIWSRLKNTQLVI